MLRLLAVSALLVVVTFAVPDHHHDHEEMEINADFQAEDLFAIVEELTEAKYTAEEIAEFQDTFQEEEIHQAEEELHQEHEMRRFSREESAGYEECEEYKPEDRGYDAPNDVDQETFGRRPKHHKKGGRHGPPHHHDDHHGGRHGPPHGRPDHHGGRHPHHDGRPDHHGGRHPPHHDHHGGHPPLHPGEHPPHRDHHGPPRRDGRKCSKPVPLEVLCEHLECAPFQKMNSSGCGYETRMIPGAKWVGTRLEDISDLERSGRLGFWKLFRYISGANSDGVKINMTIPVLYQWFMDEDYSLTGGQMFFYVPAEYQENTPEPLDDSVFIDQFDDAVIYNRAFGGNDMDQYEKEFERLGEIIEREDLSVDLRYVMTAEYTRPERGPQRHEVIVVAA